MHAGGEPGRAGNNEQPYSPLLVTGYLLGGGEDHKVAGIAGGEVYCGGRRNDDGATAN